MSLEIGPIARSLARHRTAFSLVLLEVASGFTTISCLVLASGWYRQLGTRPSGLDESDLVTVALQRPAAGGDAAAAALRRHQETMARVQGVAGVVAVAPLSATALDERWNYPVEVTTAGAARTAAVGWTVQTSPAIGQVLGLRVREGTFPGQDQTAGVTVLTRCLRDRLFPGGAPALGGLIRADDAPPARVVAVVDDVVMRDPWNASGSCVSFRFGWSPDEREARYLVRTRPGQRPAVIAGLRAALEPSGADRRTVVERYDTHDAHPAKMARGLVVTLAVLGALVVVIALLGTLTVSFFLVSERTRSIGIRRAMGATAGDIVRYFLVESSLVTGLGIALGLIGTRAAFEVLARLYPGVSLGWRPLALTAVVLWADAILGALLPARRAARIPPWVASRGRG